MMKRLAWIVPLVAACGGAGGKPDPGIGNTARPGSTGDLFAALFVKGAATQYDVVTRTTYWDDQDPTADANGNVTKETTSTMTCTVDEVVDVTGGGRGAYLACSPEPNVPVGGASPTGGYVATADGLWRVDKAVAEVVAADLTADTMLLAAKPVAAERKHEEPDGSGGSLYKVEQRPVDGAWCATRASWAGDDGGATLCFAAGKGLVSGVAYFGGGSTIDVEFELAAKR